MYDENGLKVVNNSISLLECLLLAE